MKRKLVWLVVIALMASYVLPLGTAFAAPKSEKENNGKSEQAQAGKREHPVKPEQGKPDEPAGKSQKAKKGVPVKAGQPKKPMAQGKGNTKDPREPVLGDPPLEESAEPVSIWVELNPSHVGTTSDCAAVWHFVLVNLGKGASPGVVTVTFKKAGEFVLQPYKVNQQMQHFSVALPAGDTLLSGSASVMLPQLKKGVKLNLSSVTCVPCPPPPSEEETDKPKPPPSDDETCTPTPKPPVKPKPTPVSNVKNVPEEETPNLPYTGANLGLLAGLAGAFGASGFKLRRLAKKI